MSLVVCGVKVPARYEGDSVLGLAYALGKLERTNPEFFRDRDNISLIDYLAKLKISHANLHLEKHDEKPNGYDITPREALAYEHGLLGNAKRGEEYRKRLTRSMERARTLRIILEEKLPLIRIQNCGDTSDFGEKHNIQVNNSVTLGSKLDSFQILGGFRRDASSALSYIRSLDMGMNEEEEE